MSRLGPLWSLLLAVACASPEVPAEVQETPKPTAAKSSRVRKLTLGPEHAQHLVLTRGKDGEFQSTCVRGESAARARVESVQPRDSEPE